MRPETDHYLCATLRFLPGTSGRLDISIADGEVCAQLLHDDIPRPIAGFGPTITKALTELSGEIDRQAKEVVKEAKRRRKK